jgi:hypothetical protein
MLRLPRCLLAAMLVAPVLGATGCSASKLPKTYPAVGTVYEGGQPLKGGSIQFLATGRPEVGVIGEIKSDGTFELRTIKDNEQAKGAPEGEYHVTIRPALPPHLAHDVMAAQKGMPEIKLTATVKVEPKENTFKIELPLAPQ